MRDLSKEQWERAQAAFHPFIDAFNLSLNPDDIDEIIYAIVTHLDSAAPLEAIADEVRSQIEKYFAEYRRMYDEMAAAHRSKSGADVTEGIGWVVWRQDDHGNKAEVSRHTDRTEAEARAVEFDERGHKQTYWVAQSEMRPSDVSDPV